MILTKALLEQKLKSLAELLAQHNANAHAVQGAVQVVQQLLQDIDAPETEPPPT